MARPRLEKSFADYMVIAISPVLIMLLVGSLVFFLLEVAYSGAFESRFRWILFWFVIASVLIARIAIEMGSEHARLYGLALGAATALVVVRFADAVILGLLLLAAVWWCANKLTRDCTLINESEDASGEGLLQLAGLDRKSSASTETDAPPEKRSGWPRSSEDRSEQPRRAHAPGVWVVYFSLAALPLFGFGQLLLRTDDASAREYGFQLLGIYVAAGMGLLLTTSFLGLRRYLRQRNLKMPKAMAGVWMGTGTALIAAVLLACLVLPRPEADYSLTTLVDQFSDTVALKASRFALVRGEAGDGEGRRIGESKANQKPEEEDAGGGDGSGGQNPGGRQKEESEDQPAREEADTDNTTDENGDQQSSRSGDQQGKGTASGGKQDGGSSSQGEQSSGGSQSSEKSSDDKKSDQNSQQDSSNAGKAQRKNQDQDDRQNSSEAGEQSDNAAAARDKQQQADDQRQGDDAAEQASGDRERSATSQRSAPSSPAATTTWFGRVVKGIIYLLLGLFVLYVVVRHWTRIVAVLRQILEELRNLWLSLFGGRKKTSMDAERALTEQKAPRHRPFASFSNPFDSSAARLMPPAELVVYTFDALQAWAEEHRLGRRPEQTPMEFTSVLGVRVAEFSDDVGEVGKLYARVAYAGVSPSPKSAAALERLWQRMCESAERPRAVEPVSAPTH